MHDEDAVLAGYFLRKTKPPDQRKNWREEATLATSILLASKFDPMASVPLSAPELSKSSSIRPSKDAQIIVGTNMQHVVFNLASLPCTEAHAYMLLSSLMHRMLSIHGR
jgi:hypothetical protein